MSTETNTVARGRVDPLYNVLKIKDNRENKKKKVKNGKQGNYTDQYKTKRGERDYTDEALALLKHIKPLMNLWTALMTTLDTEFKPIKKPLPRLINLQRRCSYRNIP